MRLFTTLAVSLLLAGHVTGALADTMYKCVAANGAVSYSNQACPGKVKAAKQFEIPPPVSHEDRSARVRADKGKLEAAEAQFQKRQAVRDKESDKEREEIALRQQEAAADKIVRDAAEREKNELAAEQSRAVAIASIQRQACNKAKSKAQCMTVPPNDEEVKVELKRHRDADVRFAK